jgi:hypothetical protein
MKQRNFQTKIDALKVTVHYSYIAPEPPEDPDDEDSGMQADVKIISVLSENGQDITDTLKDEEVRHLREKCFIDVAKG